MKEKRDRLLKNRPKIRLLGIKEGESYHTDLGILWTAHKKEPFLWLDKNLNQTQFVEAIENINQNEQLLMIEDMNDKYKNKIGPVLLVTVITRNNWEYEPHFEFLPWSTLKNKLRVSVAFFQWIRYQKNVGSCVVYCLEDSVKLFDKCCEYGVLHRVGIIINGTPFGDKYIYSVRGKKNVEYKRSFSAKEE